MQFFLLVLHLALVALNTYLSISNFRRGEAVIGTLWAITVPLWMINAVVDVIELS